MQRMRRLNPHVALRMELRSLLTRATAGKAQMAPYRMVGKTLAVTPRNRRAAEVAECATLLHAFQARSHLPLARALDSRTAVESAAPTSLSTVATVGECPQIVMRLSLLRSV